VLLEKQVRGVSVKYVLLTLYKMTSPVAASILQSRWQTASNRPIVDLASQRSRASKAAYVLTKAALPRHKLKATGRQLLVCAPLVYPEAVVATSPFVKQEVAERRVVQAH